MTQKIPISDTNLSRRAGEIVSELRECYPDGKISGLNAKHKTLSNKVGELWQQIGYASRDDFFAAYGFEFVRASNATGGRPISVDGEKLLQNSWLDTKTYPSLRVSASLPTKTLT